MKARDAEQLDRWLREPETILADVRAAQTPKRKNTDPRPMHVGRAMDEGRDRAKAERKRLSRKRAEASYDAKAKARRLAAKPDIKLQFVRAMQPGEWYGFSDVGRAIGLGRGITIRRQIFIALTSVGWIERTRNPAWKPGEPLILRFAPGHRVEPQWLYRLTPLGECARSSG